MVKMRLPLQVLIEHVQTWPNWPKHWELNQILQCQNPPFIQLPVINNIQRKICFSQLWYDRVGTSDSKGWEPLYPVSLDYASAQHLRFGLCFYINTRRVKRLLVPVNFIAEGTGIIVCSSRLHARNVRMCFWRTKWPNRLLFWLTTSNIIEAFNPFTD